jgi:hypothetical protein
MSLCNLPTITLPAPSFDILSLITALLALLGIPLPPMPTIPLPALFCPLD